MHHQWKDARNFLNGGLPFRIEDCTWNYDQTWECACSSNELTCDTRLPKTSIFSENSSFGNIAITLARQHPLNTCLLRGIQWVERHEYLVNLREYRYLYTKRHCQISAKTSGKMSFPIPYCVRIILKVRHMISIVYVYPGTRSSSSFMGAERLKFRLPVQ